MTAGKTKRQSFGLIMAVYLLGIFMGAIDTGIVTPARTLIQSGLGVDEKMGIWMITAFTLAYACSMPIMGKLADRLGRKSVYIVSIALFGTGSLICGISQNFASFPMLIFGRVVQALGGGGIVPLANAEFGTSFPPEKRGMALGLVGGVYGIANIMGSTLGSAVLDLVGQQNWQWIFYINVPISILIVAGGIIVLPKREKAPVKKLDLLGVAVLVSMVLCLLYGLDNLDFFHFGSSITDPSVYPFLLAFAVLIPLFLLVEKKAADPILNLMYFKRLNTILIFALSVLVGIVMMGMVFVPQFAENSLKLASGKGGYFVTILGVFAGIAAPLSGTLIDRFGAKLILFAGFLISLAGALFLAFVAVPLGGAVAVIASLVLIGLGMGFTIGTPLNYMMLASTKKEESNSALAALSLMRSIGTSIGPMLMVGFLVQAGLAAQDNLMNTLPPVSSIQVKADSTNIDAIKALIAQEKGNAQVLNSDTAELNNRLDTIDKLNGDLSAATAARKSAYDSVVNDPAFKDMLDKMKMQIPDNADGQSLDIASIKKQLAEYGTFDTSKLDEQLAKLDAQSNPSMDFNMGSGATLPDNLIKDLQSADVTTIFDKTVNLANWFFQDKTPSVILDIQNGIREGEDGVQQGIDGITSGISGIATGSDGLTSGIDGISQGISGIGEGLSGMNTGLNEMTSARAKMMKGVAGMGSGIAGMQQGLDGITKGIAGMQMGLAQQNAMIATLQQQLNDLIASSGDPAQIGALQGQIAGLTAARNALQAKLTQALAQQAALQQQIKDLTAQRAKLRKAVSAMDAAKDKLADLMDKMKTEQSLMQQMVDQMKACNTIMLDMHSLMDQTRGEMIQTQDLLGKVREGIPSEFETARQQYVSALTDRKPKVENVFQSAVNGGFQGIYIATAAFCVAAMLLLLFYRDRRKQEIQ